VIIWGPNAVLGSHDDAGYHALALPHDVGSGDAVPPILLGTSARAKYHIAIPLLSHSIANTPPPWVAKPFPNELGLVSVTTQPMVFWPAFKVLISESCEEDPR
jgi:hypothetical protein